MTLDSYRSFFPLISEWIKSITLQLKYDLIEQKSKRKKGGRREEARKRKEENGSQTLSQAGSKQSLCKHRKPYWCNSLHMGCPVFVPVHVNKNIKSARMRLCYVLGDHVAYTWGCSLPVVAHIFPTNKGTSRQWINCLGFVYNTCIHRSSHAWVRRKRERKEVSTMYVRNQILIWFYQAWEWLM